MTSREKRFEKIVAARGKEYRFEDVCLFLEYYSYVGKQKASSHITFRRENCDPIMIVVHHNKVNQYYVKRMIKILKKQYIL